MKKTATLLAGAVAALTFAMPAFAADDQYAMTKKQAKANEESAEAQCGPLSGAAKSQCKKDAEATYKKAMADADAQHEKAKADYKAKK